MGTQNGVTTSKVTAGKWTHWGELEGVDYSGAGNGNEGTAPSVPCPSGTEGLSPTLPTLRKGSKGTAVTTLQTLLDKLGYSLGPCGIDGDFGKATEAAVRSFQSDHRLAVDGVVGALTWAELRNELVRDPSTTLGMTEYRVIISGLDLTQAQAILNNYPGNCTIEELYPYP